MRSDTIFAAASGFGRAAICVIRLSGPRTRFILETMAAPLPNPRRLSLRVLVDPETRDPLDQGLAVWMPGPQSFTGEDQAELHIHGGLAVRTAVVQALSSFDGCRSAEPGEFTRRAFLNGRMDLSRVEGLADLIDAETETQRRQAWQQLEGRLGRLAEGWRARSIEALALLEAALDFTDEGDVPDGLEAHASGLISDLGSEIKRYLDDGHGGERLRDGFSVVIAGPPNAGKSTLLNALARRDVAIVSPIPGTTRDAIEVRCDLAGLPVSFIDTAGLRQTDDPVEREGIARTHARAATADLVLWLVAPDSVDDRPQGVPIAAPALRVGTKGDLAGDAEPKDVDLIVSAASGAGLTELLTLIKARAQSAVSGSDPVITRQRHRSALERAGSALDRALQGLGRDQTELVAEDLRLSVRAIGEITGRVDVEDVLDTVFASFCIGK